MDNLGLGTASKIVYTLDRMDCLITQQGKVIGCNGASHEIAVKLYNPKMDIYSFLWGGVRVLLSHESLCFESSLPLSRPQLKAIHKILRENDIYGILAEIGGIEKTQNSFCRPIRTLHLT